MTPFGQALRDMRRKRGISQKTMAAAIGVTPAYVSALEHGHRGQPSWELLQRIIGYFNVIWDEAEELQKLASVSHPRIVVDTSGLSVDATRLANRLASDIGKLDEADIREMLSLLETRSPDVPR
ncbi:helix-turn-helix domain-containing protein [Hoeflea sp. WL0058]|uniref:Helix-turn-helix domain-containing protein n=1 Tax=Flavimaribacter sediminis TaxID=2865987 RepID=A0AAE2ZP92_9HYPH|nr:helix-turn-helix domain-containing protein [Flavimaribacter sediminis]